MSFELLSRRGAAVGLTVLVSGLVAGLVVALTTQCSAPAPARTGPSDAERIAARAAWSTVYSVLQHPRCVNCHPLGDAPLQNDERRPHAQNVLRGPDGKGLVGQRCSACHLDSNFEGEHMPPGAPHWQLPRPEMPLVFEGKSSSELCRQLRDPARNGHKTPAELLTHVAHDGLVLWGWAPGDGRAPVPVEHAEFVRAMQTWIDGACDCPE